MTIVDSRIRELTSCGYMRCVLRELAEPPDAESWHTFADSWNDLPVDPYLREGEAFRRRRHSLFDVDPGGAVHPLAERPYVQAKDINKLEGDVPRRYASIASSVSGGVFFRDLLRGITHVLNGLAGAATWHHQCFQNRVTTSTQEVGDPTPWGPHRDGVDYVVTMLVGRENVTGGRTRLYDPVTRKVLYSETLSRPGEVLIADDRETLHDATPVLPNDSCRPGHRDVFIDVVTALSRVRC